MLPFNPAKSSCLISGIFIYFLLNRNFVQKGCNDSFLYNRKKFHKQNISLSAANLSRYNTWAIQ
jgi:hypothetical protein